MIFLHKVLKTRGLDSIYAGFEHAGRQTWGVEPGGARTGGASRRGYPEDLRPAIEALAARWLAGLRSSSARICPLSVLR